MEDFKKTVSLIQDVRDTEQFIGDGNQHMWKPVQWGVIVE